MLTDISNCSSKLKINHQQHRWSTKRAVRANYGPKSDLKTKEKKALIQDYFSFSNLDTVRNSIFMKSNNAYLSGSKGGNDCALT